MKMCFHFFLLLCLDTFSIKQKDVLLLSSIVFILAEQQKKKKVQQCEIFLLKIFFCDIFALPQVVGEVIAISKLI